MNKQFITYEVALILKELGFDEECIAWYYLPANATNENDYVLALDSETPENQIVYIKAPLWQQTITWIENVYNITIEIFRDKYFDTFMKSWAYQALIKVFNETELTTSYFVRDKMNNTIFYSYEEAREQAILKALELILNKTHNE